MLIFRFPREPGRFLLLEITPNPPMRMGSAFFIDRENYAENAISLSCFNDKTRTIVKT
jgi:hypothetical protein